MKKIINGIEVELTPEEIEALLAEHAEREANQPDWDELALDGMLTSKGSPLRALAEAQFTLLNDVRTLQGKPPLTAVQYKAHLKGLMRD